MTTSTFASILRHGALALTLAATAASSTAGPAATYWSPSWMASTQPVWGGDFVLPAGLPFQFNHQTFTARTLHVTHIKLAVANTPKKEFKRLLTSA